MLSKKEKIYIITIGRSHLVDLALELNNQYDVFLITFWPSFKFPKNIKKLSLFILYFPFLITKIKILEKIAFSSLRLIKFKSPTIVDQNIANYINSEILILDSPTCSYSHQIKVWSDAEIHTGCKVHRLSQLKDRINFSAMKKNYKNAFSILVPSRSSLSTFDLEFHNKIIVNPFKVSSESLKVNFDNLPGINLVFIGVICPSKGFHLALEEINKYAHKIKSITFYGSISNDDYLFFIRNKFPQLIFIIKGFVKQSQMLKELPNYNLGIISSLSEGMSLSGIQLIESGVPVIATYYSGLSSILDSQYIYNNNDELCDILKNIFINNIPYLYSKKKIDFNIRNILTQLT